MTYFLLIFFNYLLHFLFLTSVQLLVRTKKIPVCLCKIRKLGPLVQGLVNLFIIYLLIPSYSQLFLYNSEICFIIK